MDDTPLWKLRDTCTTLRLPNRISLMVNVARRFRSPHHSSVRGGLCSNLPGSRGRAVRGRRKPRRMGHVKGYLYPTISQRGETVVRGSSPISAKRMTAILKKYAKDRGEVQAFSMHFFSSGGAVSRALAGESLATMMQKAYWKNPKTAWRYMRLLEVVAPGSGGEGMVTGVSEAQYREFNGFPLSDQSKPWAAFGNQPLL